VFASHEHVPLLVSQRPFAQDAQAAPAVPHEPPDCEPHGSHAPLLQQPFGHEVPSHTQVPLLVLHSRPVPHPPQLVPAVPQEVLVSDAQGTHAPDELQQP